MRIDDHLGRRHVESGPRTIVQSRTPKIGKVSRKPISLPTVRVAVKPPRIAVRTLLC